MLPYNKNLKQLSRQLRKNITDVERHLWSKIRIRQIKGYQFYRQKVIGEYIVDFFCPKTKLIIEIDGSQHFIDMTMKYDKIREEYVRSLRLRVLRFTNTEVLKHIDGVLEYIEEEIDKKIPLSPLFLRGR